MMGDMADLSTIADRLRMCPIGNVTLVKLYDVTKQWHRQGVPKYRATVTAFSVSVRLTVSAVRHWAPIPRKKAVFGRPSELIYGLGPCRVPHHPESHTTASGRGSCQACRMDR